MPEPQPHEPLAPDGCLLHAEDVARMLGVPKTWVYAETRAGRLPHVTVGRYRRYRREAVESWIADHERGPIRAHGDGGGSGRLGAYGARGR